MGALPPSFVFRNKHCNKLPLLSINISGGEIMAKKDKFYNNRIFSAVIMIALSISILFGYQLTRKSEHIAKKLTTPVAMDPIDSSNCIACHTSEGIIGSVIMETDEGHGSEGA